VQKLSLEILTPVQNYKHSANINVVWLKECIQYYETLFKNEHTEEIPRKEKYDKIEEGNKYNHEEV
jgi:hypothetical protein